MLEDATACGFVTALVPAGAGEWQLLLPARGGRPRSPGPGGASAWGQLGVEDLASPGPGAGTPPALSSPREGGSLGSLSGPAAPALRWQWDFEHGHGWGRFGDDAVQAVRGPPRGPPGWTPAYMCCAKSPWGHPWVQKSAVFCVLGGLRSRAQVLEFALREARPSVEVGLIFRSLVAPCMGALCCAKDTVVTSCGRDHVPPNAISGRNLLLDHCHRMLAAVPPGPGSTSADQNSLSSDVGPHHHDCHVST